MYTWDIRYMLYEYMYDICERHTGYAIYETGLRNTRNEHCVGTSFHSKATIRVQTSSGHSSRDYFNFKVSCNEHVLNCLLRSHNYHISRRGRYRIVS